MKKLLKVIIFFYFSLIFTVFAYSFYQTDIDLAIAGPYDTAVSGEPNWGLSYAITSREFLTYGQKYRIRQDGTIFRIRLYISNAKGLEGFYIKIWRKDGLYFDLVGTSDNIVSDLIDGDYVTIDLTPPITDVKEGDYIGYRIEENSGESSYSFHARRDQVGVTSYYIDDSEVSDSDFNWKDQKEISGSVLPIEVYMQAPQIVFIGDSIIAGHPYHYSFLEIIDKTDIDSTIARQFSLLTGYTYQNMGMGSQSTPQLANRFTNDVINLKPKMAMIGGGVNEISDNPIYKSAFLQSWTTMIEACIENNIIPIVMLILPWSSGTDEKMLIRDDWNNALKSLVENYPKAILVDASQYVGQYRSGGPEGNLWDIKSDYNADGVHFNKAGCAEIARAIADALKPPVTAYLRPNWNMFSFPVNKCFYEGNPPDDQPECVEIVNVKDLGFDTLSDWFSSVVIPFNSWQIVIGVNGAMNRSLHPSFHTLKYMSPCSAYWVKIDKNVEFAYFPIEGPLFDPKCPIPLQKGWNFIGFPLGVGYYDTELPPDLPWVANWIKTEPPMAEHVLSSIKGKYMMVLGEHGSYHPYLPPAFNSLHYMAYGHGLWVKMDEFADLIYPDAGTSSSQ